MKKISFVLGIMLFQLLAAGCTSNQMTDQQMVSEGIPKAFPAWSMWEKRNVNFRTDLTFPDGEGPFPVVILLHGCGGLTDGSAQSAWRQVLRQNGYATLIIESHITRGWPQFLCDDSRYIGLRKAGAYLDDRSSEVYAAALMMSALPRIDSGRISVMGMSAGGSTALNLAEDQTPRSIKEAFADKNLKFYRIIAQYAVCKGDGIPLRYPVMMISPENDQGHIKSAAGRSMRLEECETYADMASKRGIKAKFVILPGAPHGYDQISPIKSYPATRDLGGRGVAGHYEPGWIQAQAIVLDFLK